MLRTIESRIPRRAAPARLLLLAVLAAVLAPAGPLSAQVDADTVMGRFDYGKMWTFEYAPARYFTETYGFEASPEWFERIRLSVLRIPGCSASFVSPRGLVATNHHCVRGAVSRVARPGERLLDEGFFATSLDEERRIPGYYADRLIEARDVTDEVRDALGAAGDEPAREQALEGITRRLQDRARGVHGADVWVQLVPLYDGGRYSAYTFRRFDDVRMVAAVELQAGFFGGDPDNFTYPRYALDFAFLRVYGDDGRPFETDHWLSWGQEGVEEGDVVFVVGNPGTTSRLQTVAQLRWLRDVHNPSVIAALAERLDAMRAFYAEDPETGEALDLRNRAFSLSNSLKAYTGRQDALESAVIMARKRDAERRFAAAIAADPSLRGPYGDLIDSLAVLQREKAELAGPHGAFLLLGSPLASSTLVRRALAAAELVEARREGAPPTRLEGLGDDLLSLSDPPRGLERRLLEARLTGLLRHLGSGHPVVRTALAGRTPEAAARALLEGSALADSASTARALAAGALDASDPGVELGLALLPAFRDYAGRYAELSRAEDALEAELGRARFEVYGTEVPPEGSSSPRITDGVVRPYEFNGTVAPVYTTFFGMYDHYHSYGSDSDWNLPERWLPPPAGLDLQTPLNFISTSDTYGGNSGSPAITPGLSLVGLNFDRNIEGLSRDFIYLPERGRNIMVDSRAILEALDDVYDADRLVGELLTHELFETEAAADRAGAFRR